VRCYAPRITGPLSTARDCCRLDAASKPPFTTVCSLPITSASEWPADERGKLIKYHTSGRQHAQLDVSDDPF
jgi:hypothetical protein